LVDRPRSDEGVGCLRAPPMELTPALAPMAAVPLADDRGDVTLVVVDLVLPAQRQLPADLGLERHGGQPPVERGDVEGAAGAGGEVGSVQEDAGVADEPGHRLAAL